ncbi:glycosyltransferase [Kallotenue papyrolyticum]|uniref:glycosyltransferase n=1 Tax=Kallotenue papyrolyticum TaxID=1325125 RepID=UPI0004AF3658|nr:glycosyltransferase [Kallotenue papyrolyticum]
MIAPLIARAPQERPPGSPAPTRRVLILAYDFPPRGATGVVRVAKFVRYLPEFGWQPVVVAATARGGLRDEGLLRQLPPDLEIVRVDNPLAPRASLLAAHRAQPSLRARLRRALRQAVVPDAQIVWALRAARVAARRLARGDIAAIFSTAPPFSVHMAALVLKRRLPALPWIMDLRDIWSEHPTITSLLQYRLQRACEGACLRAADHVVTATAGQRALLLTAFGLPAQRITTITNGFDPADLPPLAPPPARPELCLTYVGSIVANRAAATRGFFAALTQLMARGITPADLQVRLIGIFDPQIYAWAAPLTQAGLVQLRPFVPQAAAYAEMAAADVLLLLAADDREGRLSHPNKLFEYWGMGRPMLALVPDGDVARLVRDSGTGLTVAPGDVDGIVVALERLLAEHRAGTLTGQLDPERLRPFERRELTRRLAALLDAVTA